MAKGKKGKGLTSKQERFCLNIFQGMSQREAYIKAGYSTRMSDMSMDQIAYRISQKVKIVSRIDELKQKAESESIASVQERKQILTDIARASLTDFIKENGKIEIKDVAHNKAMSEYTITYSSDGGVRKTIKLHDPVKAIAELNKMERVGSHDGDVNINFLIQKIVNNLQVNNSNIQQLSDDELRLLAMGETNE